jgi:prolyl-tRNA synthetase
MADIMSELGLVEDGGGYRKMEEFKAIEVGNIFKLGSRFADSFNLNFVDEAGQKQRIVMGCYGLGPSRLMGAVVETLSDEGGLKWPEEISPYRFHIISLCTKPEDHQKAEALYKELISRGEEVLFDDRINIRAGEKFAEADMIGITHRLIVSPKTLAQGSVEYKSRLTGDTKIMSIDSVVGGF